MWFSKLFKSVNRIGSGVRGVGAARACSGGGAEPGGAGQVGAARGGAGRGGAGELSVRRLQGDGGGAGEVLGVYTAAGGALELGAAAAEADQRGGGRLARALGEGGAALRAGGALLVAGGGGRAPAALVALGARDAGYDALEQLDARRENVREAVGAGVAALAARGARRVAVDGCGAPDAAAEAAELAAWRFQEFKAGAAREPAPALALLAGGAEERAAWAEGAVRGRAQNWARYLCDMPANRLTPAGLAQAALDALCPLGVRVEAHGREWLAAQDMRAVLAVARGSCEPPLFLEAAYDGPGAADAPPVLLAAKGVTFDSGGLCLKRAGAGGEGGGGPRGSMAGAAAALAALRALAELQVPVRVRLVAPLCENMVSGQCMRVGDVVRALNGLNIQVEDTDMEGRLLLADALVYGQARHRPALVVDVATLTQGVVLATGGGAFGAFSNSEAAWGALRRAGARAGDRPWRLPLWRFYQHQLTNDQSVDLRNKGSSQATPCLGASFLRNFVCGAWLHLDISGVARRGAGGAGGEGEGGPRYLAPRLATGRPTRTLVHLLAGLADCGDDTAPAAPAAPADK